MVDPSLVLNGIQVLEGGGGIISFFVEKTMKGQLRAGFKYLSTTLEILDDCKKMDPIMRKGFLTRYDLRRAQLEEKNRYIQFPLCLNPIAYNEVRKLVNGCQELFADATLSSEKIKREEQEIIVELALEPSPDVANPALTTVSLRDPAMMAILNLLTDSIEGHKLATQELSQTLAATTEEASDTKRLFIKFARHVFLGEPIGVRDPFSDAAQVGLRRTLSAPSSVP